MRWCSEMPACGTSRRAVSRARTRSSASRRRRPQHLLRTHGFTHAPDLLIGSFYDPALDEGCAFEELISFHGGLGGPQTRPFVLYPAELPPPAEPVVGAEVLHRLLAGWRRLLEGEPAVPAQPALAARQQ